MRGKVSASWWDEASPREIAAFFAQEGKDYTTQKRIIDPCMVNKCMIGKGVAVLRYSRYYACRSCVETFVPPTSPPPLQLVLPDGVHHQVVGGVPHYVQDGAHHHVAGTVEQAQELLGEPQPAPEFDYAKVKEVSEELQVWKELAHEAQETARNANANFSRLNEQHLKLLEDYRQLQDRLNWFDMLVKVCQDLHQLSESPQCTSQAFRDHRNQIKQILIWMGLVKK